jgi:hypothetical protein
MIVDKNNEEQMKAELLNKMKDKCPNCGYCPHCGRANNAPYYPTWPPYPLVATYSDSNQYRTLNVDQPKGDK